MASNTQWQFFCNSSSGNDRFQIEGEIDPRAVKLYGLFCPSINDPPVPLTAKLLREQNVQLSTFAKCLLGFIAKTGWGTLWLAWVPSSAQLPMSAQGPQIPLLLCETITLRMKPYNAGPQFDCTGIRMHAVWVTQCRAIPHTRGQCQLSGSDNVSRHSNNVLGAETMPEWNRCWLAGTKTMGCELNRRYRRETGSQVAHCAR